MFSDIIPRKEKELIEQILTFSHHKHTSKQTIRYQNQNRPATKKSMKKEISKLSNSNYLREGESTTRLPTITTDTKRTITTITYGHTVVKENQNKWKSIYKLPEDKVMNMPWCSE